MRKILIAGALALATFSAAPQAAQAEDEFMRYVYFGAAYFVTRERCGYQMSPEALIFAKDMAAATSGLDEEYMLFMMMAKGKEWESVMDVSRRLTAQICDRFRHLAE